MEQGGLGAGQVTQIRGFADQRLGKSDDPLDPSNRRVSLIVQYGSKTDSTGSSAEEGKPGSNDEGGGKESAVSTTKNGAESSRGAKSEQKKSNSPLKQLK